jgi:hypothetical protein
MTSPLELRFQEERYLAAEQPAERVNPVLDGAS